MAATLDDVVGAIRSIHIDVAGAIAHLTAPATTTTPPPLTPPPTPTLPAPTLPTPTPIPTPPTPTPTPIPTPPIPTPPTPPTPTPIPTPTPPTPPGPPSWIAALNLPDWMTRIRKMLEDLSANVLAIRLIAMRPSAATSPTSGPPAPTPPLAPAIGDPFADFRRGASSLVTTLGDVSKAIIGMGNEFASFVAKSNPAAVIRFRLAVDDLQAVFGRALEPAFERVTLIVRKLADAFISLSPLAQQFAGGAAAGAALGTVVVAITAVVKSLIASLGPLPIIFGALAGALAGVAGTMSTIGELSKALDAVFQAFGQTIEAMAKVIVPIAASILVPAFNLIAGVMKFVGAVAESLANVAIPVLIGKLFLLIQAKVLAGIAATTLAGHIQGLRASLQAAIAVVSGFLKAFAIGLILQPILNALLPVINALGEAFSWLGDMLTRLLETIGLASKKEYDPNAKSSTGAAVRSAQFEGIESFANKQYTSALGGSTSIPSEQLKTQREILAEIRGRHAGEGSGADRARGVAKSTAAGAIAGSFVPIPGATAVGAAVGFTIGIIRELF